MKASEVRGDEAAALRWLAQAIPVPVYVGRRNGPAEYENAADLHEDAAGVYSLDFDYIHVADSYEIAERNSGLSFLSVLVHEAIHSTQFRVGRTPPLIVLYYLHNQPGFAPMFSGLEEAIAYAATDMLGRELGFDWPQARERQAEVLDGAPLVVRAEADRRAREAVEWLIGHGDARDYRPFADMLAAMVEGGEA